MRMRSISGDGAPSKRRKAWQAPAMKVLPVRTATRVGAGQSASTQAGQKSSPPQPASPETKLGFSFEMSLPLSVRTE